jgi:hypothetical protein
MTDMIALAFAITAYAHRWQKRSYTISTFRPFLIFFVFFVFLRALRDKEVSGRP